ncbi:Kidney mitochondrial carrier protein 1 [Folsomia candida]|uniref:Kidney mitochondrial carrier protein 1 n=1 Tax=Folsomia candida TaxID=158441 RepID=A0A226E114_FOLCA|nr:Kidney mitochondrial carrier protein 1 [Folsomia candida]
MSPRSGGGVYREVSWRHFIYGGAASCLAECGTFPLDTTKTRLQIQGQQPTHLVSSGVSPIRSNYSGMLDALVKIPREEGYLALYRGISPAILRQSVYGSLKFGAYYALKRLIPQEQIYSNVACAVVAGMASSALANPTDVLKVRMQAAAGPTSSHTTIFQAFRKIYKFEGVKGLWRRAGVIAGVELPVYDATKRYFIDQKILEDSFPNHLASSFVASLAAAIGSTPLDVIRTRMMSQKVHPRPGDSFGRSCAFPNSGDKEMLRPSHIYRGSWDCLMVTLRHEGVTALYRGFIPAWFRMGPWNVIFFTTYEQLLRLD